MVKGTGFSRSTDSLKILSDKIDAIPTTSGGGGCVYTGRAGQMTGTALCAAMGATCKHWGYQDGNSYRYYQPCSYNWLSTDGYSAYKVLCCY